MIRRLARRETKIIFVQYFSTIPTSSSSKIESSNPASASASSSSSPDPNINPWTGKERPKLSKSVEKGHFWEIKDLKENKGKVFPSARSDSIPSHESTFSWLDFGPQKSPLPTSFNIKNLLGEEISFSAPVNSSSEVDSTPNPNPNPNPNPFPPAGLSIVCISFKQFGYEMIPKWLSPIEKFLQKVKIGKTPSNSPLLQIRQVAVSPSGIWSLFSPLLSSSLRQAIPEKRHKNSYYIFGDSEHVQHQIGMTNKLTGYVFFIDDASGKILFRGSGEPGEVDLQLLWKSLTVEVSGIGGSGGGK